VTSRHQQRHQRNDQAAASPALTVAASARLRPAAPLQNACAACSSMIFM
jgi:hypothetical protein